jgi:hypothetical protein
MVNKHKRKTLKEKLPDEKMTLDEFVAWVHKSPNRFIRLIGDYAKAREPECETVEQWNVFLKRNLRSARQLEPFTDAQIDKAFQEVQDSDFITKWGLETILKFLVK